MLKELSRSKSGFLPQLPLFIAFCVALAPVVFMGHFILTNAVNVPYWDEWGTPGQDLVLITEGKFSLADLVDQANESRPVFPRIILLIFAYLFGWNTTHGTLISFVLVCLISWGLCLLGRITVKGTIYQQISLLLLVNLILFSPIQYANWMMGLQLICFIPIACILGGVLVAYSRLKAPLKTLFLILLCTLSTFSYANGMLAWLLVFPCALIVTRLQAKQRIKEQLWLVLGGGLGCLLNLALYFYNYQKPSNHPSFFVALEQPWQAVLFLFAFLGNFLSPEHLPIAINVGAGLLTLFSLVTLYVLIHWKDQELWLQVTGWFTIATYSIVSALVTTSGRLGFGLGAAMPSRYTTFSLYLGIALIYLIFIVFGHAVQRGYFPKMFVDSGVFIWLLVALATLNGLAYWSGIDRMTTLNRDRLQAKASLLFVNVVDESSVITQNLYPDFESAKAIAMQLTQAKVMQPHLVETSNLVELAKQGNNETNYRGFLDRILRVNEQEVRVLGWAVDAQQKHAADAVILGYETEPGSVKPVAIARVGEPSPDVAVNLPNPAYSYVRWSKTLPLKKLPKGKVKISAWAFDTTTSDLFPLQETRTIWNAAPVSETESEVQE